jgi:hypothetical protein
MSFFETSAKTAERVEEAFVHLSKVLMAKRDEEIAIKKKNRR